MEGAITRIADEVSRNWKSKAPPLIPLKEKWEKLRNSAVVIYRDRNPVKPPSPPKHLSLDDEDLKLTPPALATENKQALANEINLSLD